MTPHQTGPTIPVVGMSKRHANKGISERSTMTEAHTNHSNKIKANCQSIQGEQATHKQHQKKLESTDAG